MSAFGLRPGWRLRRKKVVRGSGSGGRHPPSNPRSAIVALRKPPRCHKTYFKVDQFIRGGSDLAVNLRSATFSRGLPLEKAIKPECLLAFVMNGDPLTRNGAGPDERRSGRRHSRVNPGNMLYAAEQPIRHLQPEPRLLRSRKHHRSTVASAPRLVGHRQRHAPP